MSQSRLTVAIPTYNRAPFLAQTLDAFARELQRAPVTGVSFLVIDNCSTDDTRAVVDRFAATVPDVAYARNETNTGAERNIMSCALTSPGEFTWIFGDDDLPSAGSLARILDNIETQPADDLYLLNYRQMNQSLSQVVCANVLEERADAELSSIREFYGFLGSADVIGFISSVVFRTRLMRAASFETYVGFGSYYGHFGALTPADLDRITAKRSLAPAPVAGCLCILEWWTERVLRDPLIASLSGPRSAAFDEVFDQTHRLVSTRDFGTATRRMREILDLAHSIRAGQPPSS